MSKDIKTNISFGYFRLITSVSRLRFKLIEANEVHSYGDTRHYVRDTMCIVGDMLVSSCRAAMGMG